MSDNTPITDNPKEEKTVFIFGKTGVGKSVLTNNILMLLQFPTLDKALASAKDRKVCHTPVIPFTGSYGKYGISYGCDANERQNVGESRTIKPRKLKLISDSWILNIVDTPGILDSAGETMDKQHLDYITACMAQFKEIHAILLLVTACDNTLNKWMKQVLNELLSCLGKAAVANIYFLVTHVGRNMNTKNASDAIGKYIKEGNTGIKLNVFGFESEPFLYLMGTKTDILKQTTDDDKYNEEIFGNNRRELQRLFKAIAKSKSYDVTIMKTLILAKQLQSQLSDLKEIINKKFPTFDEAKSELNKKLNKLKDQKKGVNDAIVAHENFISAERKRKRNEALVKAVKSTIGGLAVGAACILLPEVVVVAAPARICLYAARLLPAVTEVVVAETVSVAAAGASTMGALKGALHAFEGVLDYYWPVPDKKSIELNHRVTKIGNDIGTCEDDLKTEESAFNNECTLLESLRRDTLVYLQEYAITTTDTVSSDNKKSPSAPMSSPDYLLKRLEGMKAGKYFGKEIASFLQKYEDLEEFDFPKGDIEIKSDMAFR